MTDKTPTIREMQLIDILVANPGIKPKEAGLMAGYPSATVSVQVSKALAKEHVKAEIARRQRSAAIVAAQRGAVTREDLIGKAETVYEKGTATGVKGGLPAAITAVRTIGELTGHLGGEGVKVAVFNGVCPKCGSGVTMQPGDAAPTALADPDAFMPQLLSLRTAAIERRSIELPAETGNLPAVIDVTPTEPPAA